MPDYVAKALHRFSSFLPLRTSHAPHKWNEPIYGRHQQFAAPHDASPPLSKTQTKLVQEVVGTFLYYAITIDLSMLVALGTIASSQSSPTEDTLTKITDLLNYASTHPSPTIRYSPSDMIIHVHSDASYLSEA